jgi:hypothetical protein
LSPPASTERAFAITAPSRARGACRYTGPLAIKTIADEARVGSAAMARRERSPGWLAERWALNLWAVGVAGVAVGVGG